MLYDYDGRKFTRSDIAKAPIASYVQDGNILSASFAGADIIVGSLAGVVEEDGTLRFSYSMVNRDNEVISGLCRSTPERDPDGLIVLREEWQRFKPVQSSGVSFLKEIR